jgi:hypothetical protein
MALTSTQIANIPIDYGMVYIDFGEATERQLGPTKGGATLKITKELRDIEYDGSRGKSKQMQVIDSINCSLVVASLDCRMDNLALAMPWITYSSDELTADPGDVGAIASGDYFTNIVVFAKLVGGEYKKITLYNPMNESDFEFSAAPKAEGMVSFEFFAHWDPTSDTQDLFKIEDVSTLGTDTTPPTLTFSPLNGATDVAVDANLTATFSEAIKSADVKAGNFVLSTGGTAVAGSLAYNSSTYVVTFNPTADLSNSTIYTWVVANVRDTAGNTMVTAITEFTTVAS